MTSRSSLSRRLMAVGLTAGLGLALLTLFPPRLFRDLRTACVDLLSLAMPATNTLAHIVIVEIDDASLVSHGQWPWQQCTRRGGFSAIISHCNSLPKAPDFMSEYSLGGSILRFGETRILTDNRGQFRLSPLQPGAMRRLSAHEVLRGNINSATLKDKIVLLGCHAPGLSQSYPTPFASTTPLFDLHAAAIATLLSPRQLHQPPSLGLVEVCTALIFILLLFAIAGRYPIILTVPLALPLVVAIWPGAMILRRQSGLLLSPLLPTLALLIPPSSSP